MQSRWELGVRKVEVVILSKNLSLGKLGFGFHLRIIVLRKIENYWVSEANATNHSQNIKHIGGSTLKFKVNVGDDEMFSKK